VIKEDLRKTAQTTAQKENVVMTKFRLETAKIQHFTDTTQTNLEQLIYTANH